MNLLVIGCGHMTQAVFKKFDLDGVHLFTYTPSYDRAREMADRYKGTALRDLSDLSNIDVLFLGIKPQNIDDLPRKVYAKSYKLIVSELAAVDLSLLQQKFKAENYLRIMPNTPVAHGVGLVGYIGLGEFSDFVSRMQGLGEIIEQKSEEQLESFMVMAASAPAFVFEYAHAFYKQLIELNYDDKSARKLVNNLFLGSSTLLKNDERTIDDLISAVTSKKGVTIEGIESLRSSNIGEIVKKAVESSLSRSQELAKELRSGLS